MVDLTTPGGQHVSVPVNRILYSTENEDPDRPRGPWVNMEETETPIAAYDGELAQLPPGPDRQQINTPYSFQVYSYEVGTPLAQGTATPPTQNIIGNRDVTHVITSFTAGQTLQSISNDLMIGAGEHTSFSFDPGFGYDEITNFKVKGPGHDTLDLSLTHFTNLAQVLHHTSMMDGSAEIHLNAHDMIALDGVT